MVGKINIPPGTIKAKYPNLKGMDWIRHISPEDRAVLCRCAFAASGYGRRGGKKRAQTAQRDANGRFIKDG